MATIEIDEAELLRNRNQVAAIQKMLANPKARANFLAAYKETFPDAVVPEIDAKKPVEDALAGINDKIDKFIESQKADREKEREEARKNEFITRFEAGRERLRSEFGLTQEGLAKVEELMTKAGIVDHEIGYAAFSKLNPEPEPAPPAPNFGFGGIFGDPAKNPDEFLKAMHASKGMDEAALDKRIHEVLTETRQQNGVPQPQRRGFGR